MAEVKSHMGENPRFPYSSPTAEVVGMAARRMLCFSGGDINDFELWYDDNDKWD